MIKWATGGFVMVLRVHDEISPRAPIIHTRRPQYGSMFGVLESFGIPSPNYSIIDEPSVECPGDKNRFYLLRGMSDF